jgi:hypothetical protein
LLSYHIKPIRVTPRPVLLNMNLGLEKGGATLVSMERKWDHATNSSGSRLGRLSQTPETSEQVSRPKREKQVSAGFPIPKARYRMQACERT